MQDEDIILYFRGEVTNNLLTSILQLMDDRLDKKNEDIRIKKKVFSVFNSIQSVQLVCLYRTLYEIAYSARSQETVA